MRQVIRYPVAFDVLDAAVYECIEGYCNWGRFERVQNTSARVTYVLTANDGAPLGRVLIKKAGEQLTDLSFEDPPRVRLTPTREQVTDFAARQALRAQEKAASKRRLETARMVQSALCDQLASEDLWGAELEPSKPAVNRGGRPRKTSLTEEEANEARRYKELLNRRVSKEAAAQIVGRSYETLDKYVSLMPENTE